MLGASVTVYGTVGMVVLNFFQAKTCCWCDRKMYGQSKIGTGV